jgi:phosphonatase-like hydrolase
MQQPELLVCDVAGTSVEDRGQVPQAFTNALAEHGVQVSAEQIHAVRGSSKRQAIFQLLEESADRRERSERIYDSFCEQLAQLYRRDGVQLLPGVRETFQHLRQRGIKIVLNTGFDRPTSKVLFDLIGDIDTLIDGLVCGDEVKQGRPAPYMIFHAMEAVGVLNTQLVANVGDTILDLQAGANAGVAWNIGVYSGAHRKEQLEAQPHSHIVASVADLAQLWP